MLYEATMSSGEHRILILFKLKYNYPPDGKVQNREVSVYLFGGIAPWVGGGGHSHT